MLRRRSRLVVALATAVMAVATGAVVLVHQQTSADAGPNVPIGVYRGPGPWGSQRIPAYEQFLGRPVDMVLDYMDIDTVANQTWPDWQADAWQGSGKQLVLGDVGIFVQGGSWAQAAAGAYDATWKTLAQRLVAKGQANAILRGAHEFNGDWFHYKVTSSDVNNFITAWRRWVDTMRSVPGQNFTFEFNPVLGIEQLNHPEVAYPGDQWVDHIAVDFYDGWYNQGFSPGGQQPSQAQRDAVWLDILNGPRGLIFWRDFAAQHHKQMSFPEWGVETWPYSGDGLIHGGGDNAVVHPAGLRRHHRPVLQRRLPRARGSTRATACPTPTTSATSPSRTPGRRSCRCSAARSRAGPAPRCPRRPPRRPRRRRHRPPRRPRPPRPRPPRARPRRARAPRPPPPRPPRPRPVSPRVR